jgi:hypothetical protein
VYGGKNKSFNASIKIILVALLTVAFTATILLVILNRIELLIIGSYIIIPLILAPIVYLVLNHKKNDIEYEIKISINNKIPQIIFWLLFTISILILILYPIRNIYYYFIISLIASIIVFQIFVLDEKQKNISLLILLEIIVLLLNIIYGSNLKYDYFISRTDPIGHVWIIRDILLTGHISNVIPTYEPFPLWHILCASIQSIVNLNISLQKIMFIINGIIYCGLVILVFCIYKKLFQQIKYALLSTLLIIFIPMFIELGMSSISRSIIPILFSTLVLLLFFIKPTLITKTITILITFAILLYHTISLPFVIMIIFIIVVLLNYYEKYKKLSLNIFLILSLVMLFSYWTFNANLLFEGLIKGIEEPNASVINFSGLYKNPLNELFNYIQYSIMLLLALIGSMISLNIRNIKLKIFSILSISFLFLTIPGPFQFISERDYVTVFTRLGEYVLIFIPIAMTIGILALGSISKSKYKIITICIVIFLLSLFSISNDFTASDNPIVKRTFYTSYLSNQEITGFDFSMQHSNNYIMSDYVVTRYILFSEFNNNAHILEYDIDNKIIFKNNSEDIILIRSGELQNRPIKILISDYSKFRVNPPWDELSYYYESNSFKQTINNNSNIYSSNNINIYY